MQLLPKRTGVTRLSDDELLIFDFLFDGGASERMLGRDSYSLHMNVDYTHDLTNAQLHKTLGSLARHGFVESETKSGDLRWWLTPPGGAHWELERQPDWGKYCTDSLREFRSGTSLLIVMSPSRATAENYWDLAVRARLWKAGDEPWRHWRLEKNHQLIPWRQFSAIHVLAARGASWFEDEADWEAYESARTWWRTITELNSLRDEAT